MAKYQKINLQVLKLFLIFVEIIGPIEIAQSAECAIAV